jgi:hypothetical protein
LETSLLSTNKASITHKPKKVNDNVTKQKHRIKLKLGAAERVRPPDPNAYGTKAAALLISGTVYFIF